MLFEKEQEPLQLIRIGVVSSVDENKCTAKVYFEDRDGTVSNDLSIVVPQTMKNKYYSLPDVGETVLCCFLQNGIETGFILGSVYSEADTPPIEDKKIKGIWLEDGSSIQYNAETNTLNIDAAGPINITASGNVNVSGDVTADGVSLKNHTHKESNGSATTNPL